MFVLGKHDGGLNTNCIAYAPAGDRVASGKSGVKLWSLTERRFLLDIPTPQGCSAVDYAPDGTLVVTGGPAIRFLDPETGAELRTFRHAWCTAQCSLFTDKGKTLLSGGHHHGTGGQKVGQVVRWNLATGRQRRGIRDLPEDVGFTALSPDGRYLAGGGEKNTGWLWDLETRQLLGTFQCKASGWRMVAFSLDGATLALTAGRSIELWDPAKLKRRRVLRGHTGTVEDLAFAPDGRLLSASGDGTVRVWEIDRGRVLASLDWEVGPVNNVRVAPDGQTAVAGARDGTLVVFDLDAV